MQLAVVEVEADPGHVIVTITPQNADPVELDLEPDDARDLCNMLGGGILAASRTGAATWL